MKLLRLLLILFLPWLFAITIKIFTNSNPYDSQTFFLSSAIFATAITLTTFVALSRLSPLQILTIWTGSLLSFSFEYVVSSILHDGHLPIRSPILLLAIYLNISALLIWCWQTTLVILIFRPHVPLIIPISLITSAIIAPSLSLLLMLTPMLKFVADDLATITIIAYPMTTLSLLLHHYAPTLIAIPPTNDS